jgi:transcription elongation GreA/GreB family factor
MTTRRISFVLSGERHGLVNGAVGATTPLGSQLLGCNEEDEVEFEAEGHVRRVLIVSVEREQSAKRAVG